MCNTVSCPLYFVRQNNDNTKWKPLILDTCMTKRVEMLRNQGIQTHGCCCGHGNTLSEL